MHHLYNREINNGQRVYKCKQCHDKLSNNRSIYKHYRWNHPEIKLFRCSICKDLFSTYKELKLHENEKHTVQELLTCQLCKKQFTNKASIRRHRWYCQLSKLFKCDKCNASFKLDADRVTHLTVHSDDRRFAWRLCKEDFKRKENLVRLLLFII